jgi:hypothetical protein
MADVQDPAAPSTAKTVAPAAPAALEAARAVADAGARQAKDSARAVEAVANKTAEAGRAAAKANSEILHGQIETAQQAVRSSLEAGMRSLEGMTQNWTRAFGATAPNPDFAEKSAQNVQAVSQASSALAKGAQDASRVWFDLTQQAVRTNLEAFGRLASCRTMQEMVMLQSNLLRDNLQQAIEGGEAIARASSDAIREATRAIHPQAAAY